MVDDVETMARIELQAMHAVAEALSRLSPDAVERILDWYSAVLEERERLVAQRRFGAERAAEVEADEQE